MRPKLILWLPLALSLLSFWVNILLLPSLSAPGHLPCSLTRDDTLANIQADATPAATNTWYKDPLGTRILPALINDSVFLVDAVWIPQESKLVLLSLPPRIFEPSTNKHRSDLINYHAFNLTFRYEKLVSPMTLVPGLQWDQAPLRDCHEIPALSGDSNIDGRLFIVHCQVDTNTNTDDVHHLLYKDRLLAVFDAKRGVLNAAKGLEFSRKALTPRTVSSSTNTMRLSVCIKPVVDFHPLVPDMIEYYQQQGVSHIYLGLSQPNQMTLLQYRQALSNYSDFVSLGWFESSDVTFHPTCFDKDLAKILFDNIILNHAKANNDELLMVVDLDEVLVSMDPTRTSFVQQVSEQIDVNTTCFAQASPHTLCKSENSTEQAATATLGQHFPLRSKNTVPSYPKSIAVLQNCNYVAIHKHGACQSGTTQKNLNPSRVAIHHYASLFGDRWLDDCQQETVASELAQFQQYGFQDYIAK